MLNGIPFNQQWAQRSRAASLRVGQGRQQECACSGPASPQRPTAAGHRSRGAIQQGQRRQQMGTHLSMRLTAIWMHSLASNRSDSALGLAAAQRRSASNPVTSLDRLQQHGNSSAVWPSRRTASSIVQCQRRAGRASGAGRRRWRQQQQLVSGGLARLLCSHSSRPSVASRLPAIASAQASPERLVPGAHRQRPAGSSFARRHASDGVGKAPAPLEQIAACKGSAPPGRSAKPAQSDKFRTGQRRGG